jgi:glycosyltransferase involved in cell wall biosynthesis
MSDKPGKLKIALVAPSLKNIGGQSIQAQRLIDAFAADENVKIEFVPNDPDAPFQNVKFLRTVSTSIAYWLALFKKIPAVTIVHIFSSGTTSYIISTLPALLAAKIFGKKTILHYHTGEAETHLKKWRLTARPTMKLFDEIVVPSEYLVEVFARFALPAKAIYNFIESERFAFRARNPLHPFFLSNRNFEVHYQVGDVLRAFQLIQNKFPAAKLLIAGYGSEEANLKTLAAELNLKNTEFTGRIDNAAMPEIYDRADVYLNSSIVDNMPLSFIEAFACGLPVVSTDAGGIKYICEHEKTALLVEKNDYRSLAQQAVRLLENNELAQKIIANARRNCVKYSRESACDEWLDTYRNLSSE